MKKKNIRRLIIISVVVIIAIAGVLYIRSTDNTRFTISETKWIQENKANVINITLPTEVPGFSYNGEGIFLDFIEYLEDDTELDFNEITDDVESDYNFKIVSKDDVTTNDVVFHEETYIILTKSGTKLASLNDVKTLKLGTLSKDEKLIKYYLSTNDYVTYTSKSELVTAINNDEVAGLLVPKSVHLNNALSEELGIAYHLNDIKCSYVLSLGSDEKLNSILTKEYNLWEEQTRLLNKHFFNIYISSNNIDEITKTNFKSKRYTYGYIDNSPYESSDNYDMAGLNSIYIYNFSSVTGSEFDFKKYDSIEGLVDAFKSGKVDIMYADFSVEEITEKITIMPHIGTNFLVLKYKESDEFIDSLYGLKNKGVYIKEESLLLPYIKDIANINESKTSKKAIDEAVKNNGLVIVDENIFNYYRKTALEDYIPIYETSSKIESSFVVYNSNQNVTFAELFDDYISVSNINKINLDAYNPQKPEETSRNYDSLTIMIYLVGSLIILWIVIRIITNVTSKRRTIKLIKKDEKMKFFDMMTSLKNRNYLNQNMEAWDENIVYPQTIIIIDLNNIKYINDTHGHEAGDKVIIAAANVLINSQLEKSDIMRTNGNEFLIYLVGYKEKAVVNYIRRLYKEMKSLPYNYGASIGYSSITDDIKTVDDAINEATIDMRKNKEEEKK